MRIINLVDRLDKVNFGIWNAACFTGKILSEKYDVRSEVWFPASDFKAEELNDCLPVLLKKQSNAQLQHLKRERKLNPKLDIIVSHGCWRYPTRWARRLKKDGFRWIYVPHGMLEPWSLKQKKAIKKFYFKLKEKPAALQADFVRAVGEPEQDNLRKWFEKLVLIPNGINTSSIEIPERKQRKLLFMARLHHKKGVMPMVRAWKRSTLNNNPKFKLQIAGPDDGELHLLKNELSAGTKNVEYLGAVFGEEKKQLLTESSYFILPSASEGFPTGVLEGMQYGLLPIITEGCNFPALFREGLGLETTQDETQLLQTLDQLPTQTDRWLLSQQKKAQHYVNEHYSVERIAQLQFELYKKLLS